MEKTLRLRNVSGWFLNAILILLMGALLWKRVPVIINQYRQERTAAPTFSLPLLNGETFILANEHKPLVIVFWATWCVPCELELARINAMIEEGKIPPDSVLAISSQEDTQVIQKVASSRNYRFHLGIDQSGDLVKAFNIVGTPTVIFLDSAQQIEWMTTGLSPLLTWRIEKFLNPKTHP